MQAWVPHKWLVFCLSYSSNWEDTFGSWRRSMSKKIAKGPKVGYMHTQNRLERSIEEQSILVTDTCMALTLLMASFEALEMVLCQWVPLELSTLISNSPCALHRKQPWLHTDQHSLATHADIQWVSLETNISSAQILVSWKELTTDTKSHLHHLSLCIQKLIQQYLPHFQPYYMSLTLKGIEH